MNHPKIRFNVIGELYEIAMVISPLTIGNTASTSRTFYAEKVLENVNTIVNSYLKLIQNLSCKDLQEYDLTTLCSLSRIIIELIHTYNYLCKDKVSEDELSVREYLFSLHNTEETKIILNNLGFSTDFCTDIVDFSRRCNLSFLEENIFFQELDKKTQNKLIKGNKARFSQREKKYYKLNDRIENGLYKLFSQYIHSFGISINQTYVARLPLNFISLFYLSVETVIIYYSYLLESYIALRWRIGKKLSLERKQFINGCISYQEINAWVKYQQEFSVKSNCFSVLSDCTK